MNKQFKNCVSLVLAFSLSLGNIAPVFAEGEIEDTKANTVDSIDKEDENYLTDISSENTSGDGSEITENSSTEIEKNEKNESEVKNEENVTSIISEENVTSNISSLEKDLGEVEDDTTKNSGISTGKNGTTTWTIDYDKNTATIAPNPGEETGKMNGDRDQNDQIKTAGYQELVDFEGSLTIEPGVKFPSDCTYLFSKYQAKELHLKNKTWFGENDPDNVTEMTAMFFEMFNIEVIDLGEDFDTRDVTEMTGMFQGLNKITKLDLGHKFYTSKVTMMNDMFRDMSSLEELNLDVKDEEGKNTFDTSQLVCTTYMFSGMTNCTKLELGSEFYTGNIDRMDAMFYGMRSLKKLDLGDKFDTSESREMPGMFADMPSLNELILGKEFKLDAIQYMPVLFQNTGDHLSLDLSTFDIHLSPDNEGGFLYLNSFGSIFENSGIYKLILPGSICTLENSSLPENYDGYLSGWKRLEDGKTYESTQAFIDDYDANHVAGTYVRRTQDYKVSFDSNGGVGNMDTQEISTEDFETASLESNKFTRDDYIFTGWNTVADPSEDTENKGNAYFDNQKISDLQFDSDKNVTLYAQWDYNEITPPVEYKKLIIEANDFSEKLSKAKNLNTEDIVSKSKAKVYEILFESGEQISKTLVNSEIKVNDEDLEKIKSAIKTGECDVRLTATNDELTVEKTIKVILTNDDIVNPDKEEKQVIIDAKDFTIKVSEAKDVDIKKNSKAKAYEITLDSSGKEIGRREVEVKINPEDLLKLRSATKTGDYEVLLSATNGKESAKSTIIVTLTKDKISVVDKNSNTKDQSGKGINKTSSSIKSPKTGIKEITFLLILIIGSLLATLKTKKKNTN